jgi:hypothetical protein
MAYMGGRSFSGMGSMPMSRFRTSIAFTKASLSTRLGGVGLFGSGEDCIGM